MTKFPAGKGDCLSYETVGMAWASESFRYTVENIVYDEDYKKFWVKLYGVNKSLMMSGVEIDSMKCELLIPIEGKVRVNLNLPQYQRLVEDPEFRLKVVKAIRESKDFNRHVEVFLQDIFTYKEKPIGEVHEDSFSFSLDKEVCKSG